MNFTGEKDLTHGKKISFADTDDWGKTCYGVSFNTDYQYNVTGVELYSIKNGIVRWNYKDGITYSQAWESAAEKLGVGMNSHLSAQLIGDKKDMQNIFNIMLEIIMNKLSININNSSQNPLSHYLKESLQKILVEKKGLRLDRSFLKIL
ncbi:MAG: hypothetical protein OEV66_00850 [Spirochaetia bacterium]|nr:hypothetical protein [Spirochaetia bacterium]